MEILKVPLEREREEDEFELSLELSIGGSYGKSIKMEEKKGDPFEENDKNVSRSDFSCNNKRDLEKKRNLIIPQALRKQESCVEREDKLIQEAQQFQARVEDRENREKNGISENSVRKWEKNGTREIVQELSSDFKGQQMQKGDSGETYSSSSDTCQNKRVSRSTKVKRLKVDNSDSQTQPEQCVCMKVVPSSMPQSEKSKPDDHSNKTNNARSTVDDQTSRPMIQTSGPAKKPPKPPNHKIDGVSVRQMPRVSTTGNGPDGKTITGFLYKYTKTEVSIVCVCHGRFFSPAEFVEHAGGVDISNPLRHITIVNSNR